jgi:hypothetical protein
MVYGVFSIVRARRENNMTDQEKATYRRGLDLTLASLAEPTEGRTMNEITVRHPRDAFDDAIASGRLSDDQAHPRFAGHYMYMGTRTSTGRDLFKNIDTREYLA